jgi:hypothetical protein
MTVPDTRNMHSRVALYNPRMGSHNHLSGANNPRIRGTGAVGVFPCRLHDA